MNSLIALCADYYWEQDAESRFTRLQCTRARAGIGGDAMQAALGKTVWDITGIVPAAGEWETWRATVARRETFRDAQWLWHGTAADLCFLNVSGEPVFDGKGEFVGYRGVMHDISAEKRQEEELRRFRAAIDVSGDPILLVDRETMRFIDVNETACVLTGYTRDELLSMGPQDLLLSDPQTIEADYDELITGGGQGRTSEGKAHNRAGEVFIFEIQRRAICFNGRWIVVSIGRDITRRKRAEQAAVRLGQMYAAISGTNEVILHAKNPDELYQQVCEVAVRGGQIVSASVLVPEPGSEWARLAAVAGVGADTLRGLHISFDADRPEGHGVVGTAFRTQKACVINDFLNDPRSAPWREAAGKEHAAAGAAFPLVRKGQSVGVLLLYSRDRYAFDDEIVQLLERMARDIVFTLDNFEREVERQKAIDALRASEEKYRSILESIEEAYYEVDLSGTLTLCNEAFCRMFGYTMEEILGLNYSRYHKAEEVAYVFTHFNEVFRTGIPKKGFDWVLLHKNGDTLLCEGSVQLIKTDKGEPVGFRGMLRDVTARRAMEAALRASEERFRDLTELSSDWYWEQDNRYRFVQINGDVFAKTGMAAEDYLGKTLWELPFDHVTMEQWLEHQSRLAQGQPFYELVLKTGSAEAGARYVSISGLPIMEGDGRLAGYRGIGKDITERKVAEERIRHLASHDILTGLPNRMMFNQMLSYQVQQARRYERKFGLMFIDLDHFKTVNDTSGHDAGDVLLKETAKRLTESVRASDFVARLAGDEFVVIIPEVEDITQLNAIGQKIIAAVRTPVMLAGSVHYVTASAGICVFPDDGEDEDALLKHADAAMYEVKHSSKDGFRFYFRDA